MLYFVLGEKAEPSLNKGPCALAALSAFSLGLK